MNEISYEAIANVNHFGYDAGAYQDYSLSYAPSLAATSESPASAFALSSADISTLYPLEPLLLSPAAQIASPQPVQVAPKRSTISRASPEPTSVDLNIDLLTYHTWTSFDDTTVKKVYQSPTIEYTAPKATSSRALTREPVGCYPSRYSSQYSAQQQPQQSKYQSPYLPEASKTYKSPYQPLSPVSGPSPSTLLSAASDQVTSTNTSPDSVSTSVSLTPDNIASANTATDVLHVPSITTASTNNDKANAIADETEDSTCEDSQLSNESFDSNTTATTISDSEYAVDISQDTSKKGGVSNNGKRKSIDLSEGEDRPEPAKKAKIDHESSAPTPVVPPVAVPNTKGKRKSMTLGNEETSPSPQKTAKMHHKVTDTASITNTKAASCRKRKSVSFEEEETSDKTRNKRAKVDESGSDEGEPLELKYWSKSQEQYVHVDAVFEIKGSRQYITPLVHRSRINSKNGIKLSVLGFKAHQLNPVHGYMMFYHPSKQFKLARAEPQSQPIAAAGKSDTPSQGEATPPATPPPQDDSAANGGGQVLEGSPRINGRKIENHAQRMRKKQRV